jgi:hypothetical protein
MAFPDPSLNVLHEAAAQCGLPSIDADLAAFAHPMTPGIKAYRQLDGMPEQVPLVY